MKHKFSHITVCKDNFRKKKFLKFELKKILLKSIIQNMGSKKISNLQATFVSTFKSKKRAQKTAHLKPCLRSGRWKTSFKFLHFSRHFAKKFIDSGLIQNIRAL